MKKILGFVLAILCFLTSIGFPVQGDEVSDLQAQLEEYKAQLEAVKTSIAETQDHQSELLNQIEDLNAQMYEVEGLYTFFQSKMDEISITIQQASQTINEKDAEVKVIEKSLQERQSLLGQRLVTLYKLNRGKYLEILLSSKDFQEFGSRMTYFEKVFRQDQNLLDQTKELIVSFALQKKQLQEQRELLVRQEEQYAELKQRKEEEKSVLEGDLATKRRTHGAGARRADQFGRAEIRIDTTDRSGPSLHHRSAYEPRRSILHGSTLGIRFYLAHLGSANIILRMARLGRFPPRTGYRRSLWSTRTSSEGRGSRGSGIPRFLWKHDSN